MTPFSTTELGTAADAFQRPLRSRFQARLTAGVGCIKETPGVDGYAYSREVELNAARLETD
jgi:hypothetical protein